MCLHTQHLPTGRRRPPRMSSKSLQLLLFLVILTTRAFAQFFPLHPCLHPNTIVNTQCRTLCPNQTTRVLHQTCTLSLARHIVSSKTGHLHVCVPRPICVKQCGREPPGCVYTGSCQTLVCRQQSLLHFRQVEDPVPDADVLSPMPSLEIDADISSTPDIFPDVPAAADSNRSPQRSDASVWVWLVPLLGVVGICGSILVIYLGGWWNGGSDPPYVNVDIMADDVFRQQTTDS